MAIVVIYTPKTNQRTWRAICAARLDDLGVTVHSVSEDYTAATEVVERGEADAILVARHDHIPHGPRVIVAAEVNENPHGIATVPLQDRATRRPPRQRRPRPVN